MGAIVLGILGIVVWGDLRTAIWMSIGFLMAKSIINMMNKNK